MNGRRSSEATASMHVDQVTDQLVGRLATVPRLREIVDRAAVLFDERGYHRVSMEDIAAAVGIRKPTLYHYVRSKDQILALIHHEFMSLVISRAEARSEVAMPPAQRLLEFMADILELMHTHRGHVRVFFEHHRELPPEEQAAVRAIRDRYERMVEGAIREGAESGAFRTTAPRLTTLALFGMCNWAYQWYQREGPLRTREIAYTFWDVLLRGLEPTPDARPG